MRWTTYGSSHYCVVALLPSLFLKWASKYVSIEVGFLKWTFEVEFFFGPDAEPSRDDIGGREK